MEYHAGEVSLHSSRKTDVFVPMLHGDWCEVVFLHYRIEAGTLQPFVPLELDLFQGHAWVSLVAFTMRSFRLAGGGPVLDLMTRPWATQQFLNLRTHVRHRGKPGIYFIAEWNSSWFCAQIAPWLYGLPYHWGRLEYQHQDDCMSGHGLVCQQGAGYSFRYARELLNWSSCASHGEDDFLLERYVAFASAMGRLKMFWVHHAPWKQSRVEACVTEDSLLDQTQPWWRCVQFVSAHVSPGALGVRMGPPLSCDHVNESHRDHRGHKSHFSM